MLSQPINTFLSLPETVVSAERALSQLKIIKIIWNLAFTEVVDNAFNYINCK